MKDIEITKNIGIPAQTLQDWKKSSGWRFILYNFLKRKEFIEIEKDIEDIKRLRELKSKKENGKIR